MNAASGADCSATLASSRKKIARRDEFFVKLAGVAQAMIVAHTAKILRWAHWF